MSYSADVIDQDIQRPVTVSDLSHDSIHLRAVADVGHIGVDTECSERATHILSPHGKDVRLAIHHHLFVDNLRRRCTTRAPS